MITDSTIELKRCSKKENCAHPDAVDGGYLPKTDQYFDKDKSRSCGLYPACKACEAKRKSTRRIEHPDEVHAVDQARYNNRLEHYQELGRKRTTTYRTKNREAVLEATRIWRENNRQLIAAQEKLHRSQNPELYKELDKEAKRKRQERLNNLPNDFSNDDWEFALEYFGYRCAVCGKTNHDGIVLSPDHWVAVSDPRSDNPGTVVWNIVPLCFGNGGCQQSKSAVDPEKWIKRRLGETTGSDVLAKINDYFQLARKQKSGG